MKKIKFVLISVLFLCTFLLTGCTYEMVDLYIYKMPNRIVYEIGEKLDTTGIELKGIKTDSALNRIYKNKANFSGFDSSTTGKKEIIVSYGNFTSSFYVYVANKVANNEDELNEILTQLEDNDIVLIKEGNYNLPSGIKIDASNVVIGGQGKDKTKLNSFCIIGGTLEDGQISFSGDVTNVSIIGLKLETTSRVVDRKISFDNPNYNLNLAGINAKGIDGLNIVMCEITGFSYGILVETLNNAMITGNNLEKILVGAIYVTNSIKDSTISKNIIKDIGQSVLYIDEGEQQYIFGLNLAFNSEENTGVSIYKNSISKIALKGDKVNFLQEKTDKINSNINYFSKSSAIIVRSSGKNNLQTKGISIFFNSVGSCLNNILYNTTENDKLNSSSIMYMSF